MMEPTMDYRVVRVKMDDPQDDHRRISEWLEQHVGPILTEPQALVADEFYARVEGQGWQMIKTGPTQYKGFGDFVRGFCWLVKFDPEVPDAVITQFQFTYQ